MTGKHRLQRTARRLNLRKVDNRTRVPAELGLTIGGQKLVEVPNRSGYHYARIRGNLSEVTQVYNVKTSPVYGLAVLISYVNSRWEVEGLDTGRYTSWGSTAYIPRHGSQHSFDPVSPGGDLVWVYDKQIMPLAAIPSGSSGAGNVIIKDYPYWSATNQQWQYAGGTGTADILAYKPTGSNARMVLVYADVNGNPKLLGGSSYFAVTITGASAIMPYLPDVPSNDDIPIAGIWLGSGTTSIVWGNIYGLRPWFTSSAGTGTSSSGTGTTTTLTKNEIAFGSATNTVTSSPYFHISGAAGYADSYKSVYLNFFGDVDTSGTLVGNVSPLYSMNIGDAGDGSIHNLALWSYGSTPPYLSSFYAGDGTYPTGVTPSSGDELFHLHNYVYAPDYLSNFYGTSVIKSMAGEDIDANHLGSYWRFQNVVTGSVGLENSLDLWSRKAIFNGSVEIPTGTAVKPYPSYYHGDELIDGSWRTTRSGDDLLFQRRESGVWVTHGFPNTGTAGSQGPSGPPGDNTILLYDNNTFETTGSAIHFNDGLNVITSGSSVWVDWTGSTAVGGGGGSYPAIYDDATFKVTGSVLSFGGNLYVSVTGSTAYIDSSGSSSVGPQGPPGSNTIFIYEDSTFRLTGTSISFNDNLDVVTTGSVAFVDLAAYLNDLEDVITTGSAEGDIIVKRSGMWSSEAGIDISSDNANITAVNLTDQGSAPSAPSAGHTVVFSKSDGLYIENSSGNVIGPFITGSTAGGQGPSGPPGDNTLLLYDDDTFKVTGTAIHFNDYLYVNVSGSVAHVFVTGIHDPVTLTGDAATVLDIVGQQIDINTQIAKTFFAGPTVGGPSEPTFRTILAGDLASETPDGTQFLRDDMSWAVPPGGGGGGATVIYDDSVFKVTGSAISFDTNLDVAVTGTTAFINATAGGGGDSTYTDTFANRPSGTVNDGDLFFPSNGFYIYRVTGSQSAYQLWGPIFPMSPPPTSGWSWDTQLSGTASYNDGAIYLNNKTATASLNVYYRTAPTPPYSLTAFVFPLLYPGNYNACGICWRQASDGKIITLQLGTDTNGGIYFQSQKWTNASTFSANYLSVSGPVFAPVQFLRLVDNNTNRICQYSVDGKNFLTAHTVSRTDFLTADQVGIYLKPQATETGITVLSWQIT